MAPHPLGRPTHYRPLEPHPLQALATKCRQSKNYCIGFHSNRKWRVINIRTYILAKVCNGFGFFMERRDFTVGANEWVDHLSDVPE